MYDNVAFGAQIWALVAQSSSHSIE